MELMDRVRMLEDQLAQAVAGRRDELGWEERRDLSAHFQDRLNAVRRLLAETRDKPSSDRGATSAFPARC